LAEQAGQKCDIHTRGAAVLTFGAAAEVGSRVQTGGQKTKQQTNQQRAFKKKAKQSLSSSVSHAKTNKQP
jgi:hypothetical protein